MSATPTPHLSHRKKIAFTLVAVVLGLGLLELGARLFQTAVPNDRWQHNRELVTGLGFADLQKICRSDDRLFWRNRAGLDDVRAQGRFGSAPPLDFTVSTDAAGRRWLPERPSARHHVLFLGDSCLFGLGVDDDETAAAALQSELPQVQCHNVSVPGYTSYQGRRLLEELPQELEPDVVVVNFGRNDDLVWNDRSDMETAEALRDERSSWLGRLRLVQLLRALLLRPTVTGREEGEAEGGSTAAGSRETGVDAADPPRPRLTDAEYTAHMRSIVHWTRRRGGAPVFLLWPTVQQMQEPHLAAKQRVLLALAHREQVPVVDVIALFRQHGGQRLFADVIHANARGNEVLAEALASMVRKLTRQ